MVSGERRRLLGRIKQCVKTLCLWSFKTGNGVEVVVQLGRHDFI
jgi:hypothetical protein